MDSSHFFGIKVPDWKDVEPPVTKQEESAMQITRIALDLAKTVIQPDTKRYQGLAIPRTPTIRKIPTREHGLSRQRRPTATCMLPS
jgi:hypothetical protein